MLEIKEVPQLIFWLMLMGLTSYVTLKVAGKVRNQVEVIFK